MVEIKVESHEIVFRVLYLGGENATKFATLRGLHEELPADQVDNLTVMHASGDRIVGFRHRPEAAASVFGMRVFTEALTIPGKLKAKANLTLLLRAADALVYIDDRSTDDVDSKHSEDALEDILKGYHDLGRAPEDLPVFIQSYRDNPRQQPFAADLAKTGWRIQRHFVDENRASLLEVFDQAQKSILEKFRAFEKELEKKGLSDHIKIRDRIYEKVDVDQSVPSSGKNRGGGEIRLIRSQERPQQNRFWLIATALALVLAGLAAALVSRSL